MSVNCASIWTYLFSSLVLLDFIRTSLNLVELIMSLLLCSGLKMELNLMYVQVSVRMLVGGCMFLSPSYRLSFSLFMFIVIFWYTYVFIAHVPSSSQWLFSSTCFWPFVCLCGLVVIPMFCITQAQVMDDGGEWTLPIRVVTGAVPAFHPSLLGVGGWDRTASC